ncbi:MAG: hypothetical protein ACT4OJ_15420, partial [Bacteroidota bacterium]
RKTLLIIGIVVSLTIFFMAFREMFMDIITKYKGIKVSALILNTSQSCDRYKYNTVLCESDEFEVSISRSDCRKSIYRTGQRVELLYHDGFKNLVWPESQPEVVPVILLIFIIVIAVKMARNWNKS